VHKAISEQFTKVLLEAFKNVPTAGNAITLDGAQRAHAIIDEAISSGAKLLAGSNDFTGRTSLSPSILTNVAPDSRIARAESFAPSASFYTVENDEQAVEMANDTAYGLSASVFTRDIGKGLAMARELEFGQVHINAHTMSVNVAAPQTGTKGSGWGSNGAGWGIHEFTFDKHVSFTA
jgi:acyl-CoA reductase-like NAD-dependent aldehyde dehydrogenase